MERRPLPYEGTAYSHASGKVGIWMPAGDLVIVRLEGHGVRSFARPVLEAFESALAQPGAVRLFFDAEELATYESQLRTDITARLQRDRHRIACIDVLVKSKLVAMGVSVANLALGGIVNSHALRSSFCAALDAALLRSNVKTFSSRALSERATPAA